MKFLKNFGILCFHILYLTLDLNYIHLDEWVLIITLSFVCIVIPKFQIVLAITKTYICNYEYVYIYLL